MRISVHFALKRSECEEGLLTKQAEAARVAVNSKLVISLPDIRANAKGWIHVRSLQMPGTRLRCPVGSPGRWRRQPFGETNMLAGVACEVTCASDPPYCEYNDGHRLSLG